MSLHCLVKKNREACRNFYCSMLNQCQEKSHHMRNTEAKFSPDLQKKILGKIRYKSSQVIPKN